MVDVFVAVVAARCYCCSVFALPTGGWGIERGCILHPTPENQDSRTWPVANDPMLQELNRPDPRSCKIIRALQQDASKLKGAPLIIIVQGEDQPDSGTRFCFGHVLLRKAGRIRLEPILEREEETFQTCFVRFRPVSPFFLQLQFCLRSTSTLVILSRVFSTRRSNEVKRPLKLI